MRTKTEEDAKQRETARARAEAYKKAEESRTEAAKHAKQREAMKDAGNRRRQETERKERDLRQQLLEKMANQRTETKTPQQNQSSQATEKNQSRASEQNQGRAPHSTAQQTGNGPARKKHTSTNQAGSARPDAKVCFHDRFWPKINGRHQCSMCSKMYNGFILQCPKCGIMACASCKKRGWGDIGY